MSAEIFKYTAEFSKTGALCFVGHLDLCQTFRSAIKRAKLPVKYSRGFNPHMELGIALPLPIGYEGLAELADFELNNAAPEEDILAALNSQLPAGLVIKSVTRAKTAKSSASRIVKATYRALIKDGGLSQKIGDYVMKVAAKEDIIVVKKTKSGLKEENITNDISALSFSKDQQGVTTLAITVSAGSARNLKPETVIAAIFGEVPPLISITREKFILREN